jgi:cell cycle checkpoint protein
MNTYCVLQAELAVHCKKVEDVRRWLVEAFEGGPSGKLAKYRVRGPSYDFMNSQYKCLHREFLL